MCWGDSLPLESRAGRQCRVRLRSTISVMPISGAVGDEAFGGWQQVDVERMVEIDHVTNLLASLPFYWTRMQSLKPRLRNTINEYVVT